MVRTLAVGDDIDYDSDDNSGGSGGGGSGAGEGGAPPTSFFDRSLRSLSRAWHRSDIRPQLRLVIMLQVLQQAVGINVVMHYGATIIQAAGIADHTAAAHLALALAAVSALGSILGMVAMDGGGGGRRSLLLTSLAGCAVARTTIGVPSVSGVDRAAATPTAECGSISMPI